MAKLHIYEVEAMNDKVYIRAENQEAARDYLFNVMGRIPDHLLTFAEVIKLPEGEELL